MAQQSVQLHDKSVLVCLAHPDDEGFGCGGTLAMLTTRGARVTLVCATNGDVGEISDPALATPETLGQVRQEELRSAMAVTGVQDIRFLNYRDSGMDGAEDNGHPDSLCQADPDQVVAEIVTIIREVQPTVVITFDPTGGYGHPDHKLVNQHTSKAYFLASDPGYLKSSGDGLKPWAPWLLYYVCFPRNVMLKMWQQMLDSGITPPFAKDNLDSLGTPDDEVTTVLDVGAFVDTKIASLNCHRTQIDSNGPFAQLPEDMMREIMSTEYYAMVSPEGADQATDLLGGLK